MNYRIVILAGLLIALTGSVCQAMAPTGTYFFADKPFPEYMYLWQEGWSFQDADGEKLIHARPDMPLGGYAFVYFRNTTGKPVTVSDLSIEGFKMSQALGKSHEPKRSEEQFYSSILLSKLPKTQIDRLKQLGWPVWWKADPPIVEPGKLGKVVVRLRRNPAPTELNMGLIYQGGQLDAKVATREAKPQFATISFSPDLKTVYLYPRHPKRGPAPVKVFIDGRDFTDLASIWSEPAVAVSPIVVELQQPLQVMSYHDFKVTYSDGSAAQAGIRAWGREMVYGMWSTPSGGSDPKSATEAFVTEYVTHNINAVMPYVVGVCRDFFHSDEGWEYCKKMGVDRMIHWPSDKHDALFLFAMDEPDAHDAACRELEPLDRLGVLAQYLVNWTRILQKAGRTSPVLLNIDNTYKPENWYMYHQLPDIPCVDPYFPEQQDFAVRNPQYFSAHTKPTYVQGVCAISQSSGQPNPLHAILCSTRYADDKGYLGRYPTPEEKRMEVYYSVGTGAKGISYWWFPRDNFCQGLDYRTPEANALWKEIGILGAEVRTAGPLITTSCPVEMDTKASRLLWVRSLLCGGDTVAVIAVNENVACDRMGTMVKPVENASVSVKLPSWIDPESVIEVSADGISDVKYTMQGNSIKLDLGTVQINRFVLITSDADLKTRLQQRYAEKFAANVKALKGE